MSRQRPRPKPKSPCRQRAAETDVAVTPEGADAYDDAMLDLVALEMAAPDPADTEELAEAALDEYDG